MRRKQIAIKSWHFTKASSSVVISYDFFTRSFMALEKASPPIFEATLVKAARTAISDEKFIDSFRYSFLLIEASCGDGKFKAEQLKEAFVANGNLNTIVDEVLAGTGSYPKSGASDTDKLLAATPTAAQVLGHLVEQRGFYFHGNVKRTGGWRPEQQQRAKTLALLAVQIAMGIAHLAAAPMFEPDLARRHFENADQMGAIMTLRITFRYREPTEPVDREGALDLRVPGTKVTHKMAAYAAQQFLANFETTTPTAHLKTASCRNKLTGQPVFEMTFHGVPTVDNPSADESKA